MSEWLKLCDYCGGEAEVGISQLGDNCYALVHCPGCKKQTEPIQIPILSLYVDGVKLDKLPSKKAIERNQEMIIEKTQEVAQEWNRKELK